MKLILSYLLLFSTLAFAIPEDQFEREFDSTVMAHFQTLTKGSLKNGQGLSLNYRYLVSPAATKTLVILPGRGESTFEYAELAYDLRSPALNVFILDHQGQGESDRTFPHSDRGHVRHFRDYVNDVALFMRQIVLPKAGQTERLLFANSMGGLIGIHYLRKHPKDFARAILNVPMLQINTEPYTERRALQFAGLLHYLGQGSHYAPGYGPYVPEKDKFETNNYTHSLVRYTHNKTTWQEHPEIVLGGPTVDWVWEAIKNGRRALKFAAEIETPVLLFQAGQDTVVKNERQISFCRALPRCQIVLFASARHGIKDEQDRVRDRFVERVQSFLQLTPLIQP